MRAPNVFLLIILIIILRPVFLTITFLDLIETNIDVNVDPCEDFYRHACSKNEQANLTINNLFETTYEVEIDYLYHNYSSYLNSFLNYKTMENISSLDLIVEDFKNSCETRNQTTMIYFLEQLQEAFQIPSFHFKKSRLQFLNLQFDADCERSSKILRQKIKEEWKLVIEVFSKYVKKLHDNIHAIRWIERNNETVKLLLGIAIIVKQEILKQIPETKWINASGTETIITNIMNQVNIFEVSISEIDDHINKLNIAIGTISRCASEYKFASLKFLCYLKIETDAKIDLSKMNAYNIHPHIFYLNGLLIKTRTEENDGFLIGGSAWVVAHEIAHSIIKHNVDFPFIPYFPKDLKTCVQNQFESTCRYFKEDSCETRDEQFEENGSDIFATHLAFDVFRFYAEEIYDEIMEGSRYKLTHGQSFFYSLASQFCSRANSASSSESTHHAFNARVNAASAQIPEFQQFFGCHPGTKMMKSRTEQCHIIGKKSKYY
ncbi:unnamed protein product [Caenorhabditis angaria]|uniref:Peptidase M13 C-terminal domain-containing protein n=1 Tax=Caenorhabditis angaria TaxID=860376 RepID=A0A9P1J1R7_9PELO|nr:unnamed protein product [Caenorhabditis angaria]